MAELGIALVLAGVAFVVLAIVVKTMVVAIVAAVVVFIAVGFGRRIVADLGRQRRIP